MRKITRRSFLTAAAACGAAAALSACGGSSSASSSAAASSTVASASVAAASNGEKFTVGICQLVQHAALDAATQGFEDALTASFGENVTFDFQNAQGDSATCATIANGFVSSGVALIMANATPALQAAQAATNTIPILGTSVTEYGVALGLDNFSGTVGGNVSGTSDLAPLDQQADMIVEWMPEVKKVGLLYCSAEANSQYQVDEVQKYLEAKGVTATQYAFSDSNDLSSVCQKAADENDALYVPTDNTVPANTGIVDGICRPAKTPVFAGEEGICSGCGVATLSISYYDLGYTTGEMAVKILIGEMEPDEGTYIWGVTTSQAYFPKDFGGEFDNDYNITEWLTQYSEEKDVTYVRGFLGRMLFSGEDGVKKVAVLSGGEKVRCLLSKMMISGANVLVYDEPTNHLDHADLSRHEPTFHLDMESITALINGQIKFPGVLLFTSRDHQIVQTTANRIMEIVPGGKLIDKITTYDEYLESDEMARKRQTYSVQTDDED